MLHWCSLSYVEVQYNYCCRTQFHSKEITLRRHIWPLSKSCWQLHILRSRLVARISLENNFPMSDGLNVRMKKATRLSYFAKLCYKSIMRYPHTRNRLIASTFISILNTTKIATSLKTHYICHNALPHFHLLMVICQPCMSTTVIQISAPKFVVKSIYKKVA